MRQTRPVLVGLLLGCVASVPLARGDAREDLRAGQEALAAGQVERAVDLLRSAAEALPDSVEAQLALADAHVQAGQLEDALDAYRRVLELSPDHARARRMVEALTGRRATVRQRLDYARALIDVQAYPAARETLESLLKEPLGATDRRAAQLLLAEARLWAGQLDEALADAMLLAQDAPPEVAGPARCIAALALTPYALDDPRSGRAADAERLLEPVADAPQPWADRVALVRSALQVLRDDAAAEEVSQRLRGLQAGIPAGAYRRGLQQTLAKRLLEPVRSALEAGRTVEALAIVWPMVSGGQAPDFAAIEGWEPAELDGGWLRLDADADAATEVVRALMAAGRPAAEAAVALRAPWLAASILLAMPPGPAAQETMLTLIDSLAAQSRPDAHVPGEALSPADTLQYELIRRLGARPLEEPQRRRLANAITQYVERYARAGDLATGLAAFVQVDAGDGGAAPTAALREPLSGWPAGDAHRTVLTFLAGQYEVLGQERFAEESRATVLAPDAPANEPDLVAAALYGQAATLYPEQTAATEALERMVSRYAQADRWAAAQALLQAYHRPQGASAGQWALAQMALREGQAQEQARLAARRRLPDALLPPVREALLAVRRIVDANPTDANRSAAIAMVNPVVERYMSLDRPDLAEAVILVLDSVAAADDAPRGPALADWALWTRADLLDRRAREALARQAAQFNGAGDVRLHELHARAIELLGTLVEQYPRSPYAAAAVGRLPAIAAVYAGHRAFDVAAAILEDFVRAHPDLAGAEALQYARAATIVARAQHAFAEREPKDQPPERISEEYAAAIEALTAFLQAYPQGAHAAAAGTELFGIARAYGAAGAWDLAREVIGRFAAAVPDLQRPERVRFLEAATYIGQLDAAHGLELLSPPSQWVAPCADTSSGRLLLGLDVDGEWGGYSVSNGGVEGSRIAQNEPAPPPMLAPGRMDAPATQPALSSPLGPPGGYGGGAVVFEARDARDEALAMVRQSEQRQFQQLARLEEMPAQQAAPRGQQGGGVVLPQGPVLTEAEVQRQDAAADEAYAILLALVQDPQLAGDPLAAQARGEILWLIGFFEGQERRERAVALIDRYLADRPEDPAHVPLAWRAVTDLLAWASAAPAQEGPESERIERLDERFARTRERIDAFLAAHGDEEAWRRQARQLRIQAYRTQASLMAPLSRVRAGGLLVRAADEVLALWRDDPQSEPPQAPAQQLWEIADQLAGLGRTDAAIHVFAWIPQQFPGSDLAGPSVLRIAELHATGLAAPLQAVEAWQEYLSLAGPDASVRDRILAVGQLLAEQRRHLEALHVYSIFVDSFPADAQSPQALLAMGQIHQANEAWAEAIDAYQRILDEYAGSGMAPQVKLAIAECRINRSEWRQARALYEEYLEAPESDAQAQVARRRIDVLKSLDRYQTLLADEAITRNRDDAQFQIARIVVEQLDNHVKGVEEFRKVVAGFPQSHLADDAQLEIGKALLALGRTEEARDALMVVPRQYPTSPLADDALLLVGQSFERQAEQLASVSAERLREESFSRGQRLAYQQFQAEQQEQFRQSAERRSELRAGGKVGELAIEESYAAARLNGMNDAYIANTARNFERLAETESALQVANRQDRVNEAYRSAVTAYARAAADYPLGDATDEALERMAVIYETQLRDPQAAMQTYQRIVQLFPGTPVAENGAWKVARFHEQQGQYEQAVNAYREFIRTYPASPHVADAQFALAEALEQLGRWVEAMDAYQTFRDKFQDHPRATVAQEQIQWIRAYH